MKQILLILTITLLSFGSYAQGGWIRLQAKPVTECVTYDVHKIKVKDYLGDSVKIIRRSFNRQTGAMMDRTFIIHQDDLYNLTGSSKTDRKKREAAKKINLEAKTND